MGILADRLDPVTIRAQSPGRTVRASLTYHEGLLVRIKPGTIATTGPAALSREITETVNRALRGFRTAGDTVHRRESSAEELERLRHTETGRALRPYLEALERLTVEATGDRDAVSVVWGGGDCRVTVHDHARFGSDTAVTEDVNEALRKAQAQYTARAAQLAELLLPQPRGDHR